MTTSFHRSARCPHIGLKEGGEDLILTGGLLPFPRTGCVLYARQRNPINSTSQTRAPVGPDNADLFRIVCTATCHTCAPTARPSVSSSRSQLAMWFQLVNVRLTML